MTVAVVKKRVIRIPAPLALTLTNLSTGRPTVVLAIVSIQMTASNALVYLNSELSASTLTSVVATLISVILPPVLLQTAEFKALLFLSLIMNTARKQTVSKRCRHHLHRYWRNRRDHFQMSHMFKHRRCFHVLLYNWIQVGRRRSELQLCCNWLVWHCNSRQCH